MHAKIPIKVVPYQHQKEAFDFAMKIFNSTKPSRGVSLLMEMGCGKTLASIAISGKLYETGKIARLLIICPLSIVCVWNEEFQKFADFQYHLSILKGGLERKIKILNSLHGKQLQIAVINYESTWRLEKEILSWNPDMIIADESHKMKTHNIAASKTIHKLGAKAKYKMILTGTVITNKAIDVFSQYKFVDPSIFGKSFYAFRNRYFDMVGYGGYTPVLKESRKDELMQKLHSIAFRATKAECLDLPPSTDILLPITLEPKALNIYKNLVKDSFSELGKGEITVTNVLTKLLRLSQLTGGFIGNDNGDIPQQVSTAKINALEDIIDNAVQSEKKIVVIAKFLPEIKAIQKLLCKKHILYSVVSGETNDREEQIHRFQKDPEVLVFIGQIATAGLGITLTSASTMVFYSLDYSMSNFEQAKARTHRVGQQKSCTYIYLIATNTVDEKILTALQTKANLSKQLIDEYKSGNNPYEFGGNLHG